MVDRQIETDIFHAYAVNLAEILRHIHPHSLVEQTIRKALISAHGCENEATLNEQKVGSIGDIEHTTYLSSHESKSVSTGVETNNYTDSKEAHGQE